MKSSAVAYEDSALSTNKVLKNTYLLLSATLGFSALTAWIAIVTNAAPMGLLGLFAMIGLLFAVKFTQDSIWGLPLTFIFTGFMGYIVGPMVGMHLEMANGPEMVLTAFGATSVAFISLSMYAIRTRKDFSYMGGFLLAGLIVALVAMIANIFLMIPVLSLVISAVVVMIMVGLILFDTSRIVNGGETNYISATISLYLDFLNMFVHLLNILGIMNND